MSFFLASCSRGRTTGSVIVIAVEGLTTEDLACGRGESYELERPRSGFSILCQEFISLQGVIAPTTSSVANMSSFLTGLDPQETHVQLDDDVLSSSIRTWPEKFQALGWRTGFFNGSPPISRRTNLMQGFSTSDENLLGFPKTYFRPIDQSLQMAWHWISDQSERSMTLVTSADILNWHIDTQTDTGEVRQRSIEGQIEELDESLFSFLSRLKKDPKIWASTELVIFSLRGRSKQAQPLPAPLDLNPSKLVLATLIKPAGPSSQDNASLAGNWSLSDVGKYLEWRAVETKFRQLGTNEVLEFFEHKKRDFASASGCLILGPESRICRRAFFDDVTWLPWDESISTETSGRSDLLASLSGNSITNQIPKFNSKVFLKQWEAPQFQTGEFQNCIKDFKNLKATRPFQQVCPSAFLQLLRKLFLVSKAKLETFSELREIRQTLVKQWNDFKTAKELYDRIQENQLYLQLNSRIVSEIIVTHQILQMPELEEIRRDLDKGFAY